MKKTKKAQIAGQVFVYILAIFIFAVIMLFGYTAIKGFIDRGEQASFIQFKSILESEVSSLSTQPGDVTVFNERKLLPIAAKYKTVCFVSSAANSSSSIPPWLPDEMNQIIKTAIDSKIHISSENLFLYPPAQNPVYLGYIITAPEILCKNITQSRIDIRIEGLGYGVKIS